MDPRGRSAIVAGGAGGLGGATARRLVARGAGVLLLDPDEDRAASLVAELGEGAAAVAGDSNDDDAVGEAVELIVTNPYLNGEVIRLDGGARLSPKMR
jgi:NAD(P)-dependent dehydrogenase (short-subunit alcohol dehydrogenase family)